MVLKDLLIKITADVSGLKLQMAEAEKSIDGLKNKTEGLNTSGNLLARMIGGVLATAFTQVTTQIIASTLEITSFDKNLIKAFQTITGGASIGTKEFSQFSNEVQDIGKTTTIGARDAAGALILLGKATKTPQEAMKVFKEASLLAEAGITDVGTASSLVGVILRTFSREGLDVANIVDTLGGAALKGKVELNGMDMMLRFIGSTARIAGVSFKELMTGVAILSQQGQEGRRALLGMRGAISDLMEPSSTLSKLLESWGIKTIESTGDMKPLETILKQTAAAVSNNSTRYRELVKAGGDAFTILVDGAKEYSTTLKDIDKSRALLKQNAKELNETLPQAWDKLSASARAALISMGENLRGPLVGLLHNLSATLIEVSNSIDAESITILGNALISLVGALPQVVEGLKPVVKLLGWMADAITLAVLGIQKAIDFTQTRFAQIKKGEKPSQRAGNVEQAWFEANTRTDERMWNAFKFPTGRVESPIQGYGAGAEGREAGTFQTPYSAPTVIREDKDFTTTLKSALSDYIQTVNKRSMSIIEIMKEVFEASVPIDKQLVEKLKQLLAEHKKKVEKIQGATSIQ